MKKTIIAAALAAFTSLPAQSVEIYDGTTCADVIVSLGYADFDSVESFLGNKAVKRKGSMLVDTAKNSYIKGIRNGIALGLEYKGEDRQTARNNASTAVENKFKQHVGALSQSKFVEKVVVACFKRGSDNFNDVVIDTISEVVK